jgi:hypothetical protein
MVGGTGGRRAERRGFFRRRAILPIGFVTTRFVVAPNETEAARVAIEVVRPEADPLTLADAPWTLTTTEVEPVDDAEVQSVRGFTFYRE